MEESNQKCVRPTLAKSQHRRHSLASALIGAAGLGAFLLLGACETGRTNKTHADWQHLSDDTTTSKPESKQAMGPGEHHPPVPGSPTAAGPDGNQPPDDMQAASRHEEPGASPAAPR